MRRRAPRRHSSRPSAIPLSLACSVAVAACTGVIGEPFGSSGPGGPGARGSVPGTAAPPADALLVATSGLRRLSTREYDRTVRDLLGDSVRPSAGVLPEDVLTPFDNDYTTQIPSSALVEGAESLAFENARSLVAAPERRARAVGCEPAGAGDAVCFRTFVESFGRRAFRRPLTEAQIARYQAALALSVEANDFYAGVGVVVASMLQDPRFLYRVELGTPVAGEEGLFALDAYEVATRLSFFLWGSSPDDALLDRAEAGMLDEPESLRAIAGEMLRDARSRDQIDRFHAMWLGYERLPHGGELGAAMRAEAGALVERVVFEERRPWQDLFRMDETFVDATLAEHYGLPAPGAPAGAWVPWGETGRRGILSTAAFLSLGAKMGDTSPTQRGKEIRARLLCQEVPDPPPGVNVDEPPPETADAVCKWDRFAVHRTGGCAGCHSLMDPIGFGLERFDSMGRFRTVEEAHPECEISGDGELVGIGTFNGPVGLSDLLVDQGLVAQCLETQIYRFATGRYSLDANDTRFLGALAARVGTGDFRLDDLVLALVTSEAFVYRREAL